MIFVLLFFAFLVAAIATIVIIVWLIGKAIDNAKKSIDEAYWEQW